MSTDQIMLLLCNIKGTLGPMCVHLQTQEHTCCTDYPNLLSLEIYIKHWLSKSSPHSPSIRLRESVEREKDFSLQTCTRVGWYWGGERAWGVRNRVALIHLSPCSPDLVHRGLPRLWPEENETIHEAGQNWVSSPYDATLFTLTHAQINAYVYVHT